ncbi:AAA family ATPase [Rheinheimera maricola]|uniref:ATP-binding protein n=1 Tax=Rheinheimera maricola TaxID=2793282 RepID=A0ABS7X5K0_9GAMM|nr:ATP-binding protein [Rheinheimera maricola]MBZ9610823.1 ATP-binding protein [Rheinheimera maricola]
MEQVFLKPISATTYHVNPTVSADLAIAVRWVLQIQQRYYRYRCAKALEFLGFKEDCAERLITDESAIGYNQLISTLDEYIASQPALSLETNIQQFGQLFGLTALEVSIFRFVLIARSWRLVFSDVRASRYYATSNDVFELVAHCINANADDVEMALMPSSTLALCNLVTMERGSDLADHFRSLRVFDKLFANDCNPNDLLQKFSHTAEAPELNATDFPYLADAVQLMQRLLSYALSNRQTGVNFLLYGPPGTGKTELAKWLGHQVGRHVMGVSAFSGVDVHGAKSRLNALLMCQRLYAASGDRVLIFDEADDVLPSQVGIAVGNTDALKMAINQLLETNATPCIWICNSIRHFDSAQLRRFSQIIHVETPPQAVRQNIAERYLADTGVSKAYISALAYDEQISPALLAQLAKGNAALSNSSLPDKERDFDLLLNPLLQARLGRRRKVTGQAEINPAYYNTSVCMAELARQFKHTPDIRLCLYGPPGTGKTSYAAFLAQQAQKPLLKKNASELLGSFVGETEKAIADAFAEAQHSGAILLLDEVDSFLGKRQQAERHWQKTMTNELLAQLDQYQGALVCTTNFIELLDPAAVRRFDLKIQLDYLTAEQAWQLFCELTQMLSMPPPLTVIQQQLTALKLTPADFAIVKRQMRLQPREAISSDNVIAALRAEADLRQPVINAIGFVH